ncbi:5,6-dimethylbenzimidazole synthase [subsurface metagenome]
MELLEAIRTRRSIRRYKSTPVDDKTIELVLEAARWAPSWKNTQCWRFIAVRDNDIKSQLANITTFNNPSTDAIRNAPVVIVACAELGKSGYSDGQQASDKGDWYMFDVALAMQNLVLAAHSLGLGTVYNGLFDAKKAATILNVPAGFCVVSLTPLGYPDQEPAPRPRKELAQIAFYDKFGSK